MCENIIGGVITNIISFVLTLQLAWIVYHLFRRRKLLKFFGIGEQKRITVYLSNIRVVKGGSLGTDGQPRAYSGTTVTVGESLQANLFLNLFSYLVPGLSSQPGILRYLLVSDIQVVIAPSPVRQEDIDRTSTIVTLGSPGYNIVSEWVERTLNPRIRFTNDNSAITVNGLPNITDDSQSFIQRIYDPSNKRWVFYTAGLSEFGTIGAAYFLASRWRHLYKKFVTHKFEHVISVNAQNYQQSTIVI
jgi:hypothetical protein